MTPADSYPTSGENVMATLRANGHVLDKVTFPLFKKYSKGNTFTYVVYLKNVRKDKMIYPKKWKRAEGPAEPYRGSRTASGSHNETGNPREQRNQQTGKKGDLGAPTGLQSVK